jgi:hypothetical protein
MTSSRRRLGLQPRLLDNSCNNNRQFLVMRIFLFGQRERRRPVVEVGRVPSLGPHHREESAATVVGRGET